MNLDLHYFSGTGNARNVCHWISQKAQSKDYHVDIYNIAEQRIRPDHKPESTIGFCYPTHGFNAPPIVLKYIWRFPRSNGDSKFFVVNTRAGLKAGKIFIPGISGLAILLPTIFMLLKGYRLVGYRSIDLPSNWISLHPGLKRMVIESIFERCNRITNEFSKKLLNGKKVLVGFWWLPIDILLIPVSVGYYFMGRFALSKTFIATNNCNNCGLCVENCPVNAIVVKDNFPYWTYKCESCMRCMNMCPKRAIETPHGATFLIWWAALTFIPAIVLRYSVDLSSLIPVPQKAVSDMIFLILSIIFIFISYRITHYLMKFRWFNNLIKYTSLTHFKFWRRYRAPKNYQ